MRKLRSGIFGLNPLVDGGFNFRSSTVVIGPPGVGKTTFAIQFLRRGLEDRTPAVFISLDENREQIVREAENLGWTTIHEYIQQNRLLFIDASGRRFGEFIRDDLPPFIKEWDGAEARIVVDPLTPVLWSIPDRLEQRDVLSVFFKEIRRLGTVLCTLEDHGPLGEQQPEAFIPQYLADNVIRLGFDRVGGRAVRDIEVTKCRNSRHSPYHHRYSIVRGFGIMVAPQDERPETPKDALARLRKALEGREGIPAGVRTELLGHLAHLTDGDFEGLDPAEVIQAIIREYEASDGREHR